MSGDSTVALISGGNGGIGKAAILELKAQGFVTTSFQLTGDPSGADFEILGDVRSEADCKRAIDAISDRFGRLDALVNCAGINAWGAFEVTSDDTARTLFDINVWGTVNLMRAAVSLLQIRGGAVVTMTSTAGELGIPGTSIYGMGKAALDSLARTLAVEWGDRNVRVNTISATIVRTPMNEEARSNPELVARKVGAIPLGRIIEPEEVASTIAFLCGSGASGITGSTIRVDGGTVIKGV